MSSSPLTPQARRKGRLRGTFLFSLSLSPSSSSSGFGNSSTSSVFGSSSSSSSVFRSSSSSGLGRAAFRRDVAFAWTALSDFYWLLREKMATAAVPPFEAAATASPTSSAAASSSSSSQAAPSSSSSTSFRSSYPAAPTTQPQTTPSSPPPPLPQSSGRLTARESALLSIRMQQWLQTTKHELSREEKSGFVSSSKKALVHAGLCGLCAAAAASRCSPSLGVRLLSFGAATSVASSVLLPIYRRRQWERLLLQQPHTPFTAAAAQALSDIRSRAAPSRFLPPSPLLPLQQQQLLSSRQSTGAGVSAECASRAALAGEAESSSFVAVGAAASSSSFSPSPLHSPSRSHVTDAAAASPSPPSSGGARGAAAAAAGRWDVRSTSGTSSEERDENSSNSSSWFPGEAAAAQEGGEEEERDEEAAEANGWKQPDALDAWQAFRVSAAPESRACAKCYQQHERNPKHAVESRTEGHSAPPAPVYRTWEDVRKEGASASTGAAYPYSTTLQQQWSHEVHNEQHQQRQFPRLQQASHQQQQAPAFAEYRTWAEVRRAAAAEEEKEHGGTRRQQQRNNSWDRVRSVN